MKPGLAVATIVAMLWAPTIPSAARAQGCSGESAGYFDGAGNYVVRGRNDSCPNRSAPSSQDAVNLTFEVPNSPLCVGTPDGRLLVTERRSTVTGELLGTTQVCAGPQIPLPPGVPLPPSALEVFRSAQLPMPEVHINPRVRGLVGLETWLWWGADTNPPSLTATAGEWSATIEVHLADLTWDMGNGDILTAESAGTSESDPSVTYVYEHQCDCTVTLTVNWTGVVTLTHPLAPIPVVQTVGPVSFSDSFPYPVEEREAVIVG